MVEKKFQYQLGFPWIIFEVFFIDGCPYAFKRPKFCPKYIFAKRKASAYNLLHPNHRKADIHSYTQQHRHTSVDQERNGTNINN